MVKNYRKLLSFTKLYRVCVILLKPKVLKWQRRFKPSNWKSTFQFVTKSIHKFSGKHLAGKQKARRALLSISQKITSYLVDWWILSQFKINRNFFIISSSLTYFDYDCHCKGSFSNDFDVHMFLNNTFRSFTRKPNKYWLKLSRQ